MNNLSLDSHLVFIKDQIEWCEGCVIDRDENDNPICVRNYCNLDTAKYWLDMFIELEKDLGCPLEVLAKILLYPKIRTRFGIREIDNIDYYVEDDNRGLMIYFKNGTFDKVSNYKKTWWLSETKEE